MRFSEILHQSRAIERLTLALAGGRVPHALLFAGPDGVGKELTAWRLAQRLLCRQAGRELEACGNCEDCRLFGTQECTHPDVHRIHRALNKVHPDPTVRSRKAIDLSIDVIRHFLLEKVSRRASRGGAKVFLVVEADRLTMQAQNAMLKTLEEPPADTFIVLLTASADAMLATTRSRCQTVSFGLLPEAFVAERLQAMRGLSAAEAHYYAQLSEGRLGPALSFADRELTSIRDVVVPALARTAADPLAFGKLLKEQADGLAKQSKAARDDADDEGSVETSVTRAAQETVLLVVAQALRAELRAKPGPRSQKGIRAVHAAETRLDQNANAGLVFDSLAIELAR